MIGRFRQLDYPVMKTATVTFHVFYLVCLLFEVNRNALGHCLETSWTEIPAPCGNKSEYSAKVSSGGYNLIAFGCQHCKRPGGRNRHIRRYPKAHRAFPALFAARAVQSSRGAAGVSSAERCITESQDRQDSKGSADGRPVQDFGVDFAPTQPAAENIGRMTKIPT